MRSAKRGVGWAALALAAGCGGPLEIGSGDFRCGPEGECGSEFVCDCEGWCVFPSEDVLRCAGPGSNRLVEVGRAAPGLDEATATTPTQTVVGVGEVTDPSVERGPPPCRTALRLDGSDDYIAVPHDGDLSLNGPFTIDLWVEVEGGSGGTDGPGAFIVAKDGSSVSEYMLSTNTEGTFDFLAVPSGGAWSCAEGAPAARAGLRHIAGVYDGTAVKLYVDGVLLDERVAGTPAPNGSSLLYGKRGGYEDLHLAGLLADVRIWQRALRPEEIAEARWPPTATSDPTLVAWWPLAGDARDAVGEHHGVAYGGPEYETVCSVDADE